MRNYPVMLGQDEQGTWVATFPTFPGVSAHGDTAEQAEERAREALSLTIQVYQDVGWDLP